MADINKYINKVLDIDDLKTMSVAQFKRFLDEMDNREDEENEVFFSKFDQDVVDEICELIYRV